MHSTEVHLVHLCVCPGGESHPQAVLMVNCPLLQGPLQTAGLAEHHPRTMPSFTEKDLKPNLNMLV